MRSTLWKSTTAAAVILIFAGMSLGDEPAGRGERTRRVTGVLTKLDAGVLTVTVRGDAGERTLDAKIDNNTAITVESEERVRVFSDRGELRDFHKAVAGKASDLRVGQRVTVVMTQEGVTAEVIVPSAAADREPAERARRAREAADREGAAAPSIQVLLNEGGGVAVGERKMESAEFAALLSEAVKKDPRIMVVIRVAPGVRIAERKSVLDAMRTAGVTRWSFMSPGERAAGGDAPAREGDRPRGDLPRQGDAPRPAAARDGDRKQGRGDVVSGDIAKVSGNMITVNAGGAGERGTKAGATPTIQVSPDAKIIIEGSPVKLSDLQPGMPVTITMQNNQAVRVEVPIDLSKPKK